MTFPKQNWFKFSSLLLLYLFFGSSYSMATSGACSYHNGVNCSIKSYDGYAVCKDNFVSSTYYSDTVECACTYPSKYGYSCTTDTDHELLRMELDEELEAKENRPRIGGFITKMETDEIEQMRHRNDLLLIQCQGDVWDYHNAVTKYDLCRDTRNSISTLPRPTPTPRSCPANSYDNSDRCTCISGYVANTSRDGCVLAPTPTPTPTPRPTPPPTPISTPISTPAHIPVPIYTSTPKPTKTVAPKSTNKDEKKDKIIVNTATVSYGEITKKDNVLVRVFKLLRGLFK